MRTERKEKTSTYEKLGFINYMNHYEVYTKPFVCPNYIHLSLIWMEIKQSFRLDQITVVDLTIKNHNYKNSWR